MNSRLSPASRASALDSMQGGVLDVLVVGAGATGSGTALDAASRGLRVGLIDKGDIASGTSSRSSQLVHGGLRYLQRGDIGLVKEALRERDLLLTTLAPNLVRPMRFLLPLRHRVWERMYLGTGVTVYDVLASSSVLPRHRHLSHRETMSHFPSLRNDGIYGAIEYFDAKMDDARLGVAIARTAAEFGATVATYVSFVSSLHRDIDGTWRIRLRDETTAQDFEVRAKSVALCTGVWAPEASKGFGASESPVAVIRSKGAHIRLPREAIRGDAALTVRTKKSVLFVIPETDHWLVGTTDTEWESSPDEVSPSPGDVSYLLDELRGILSHPITEDQVTWSYAGLRPLVRDEAVGGDTAKVTREHRIARVAPNVLSIVGGKWTTYRVMARDMVDTLVKETGLSETACRTESIALVDTREHDITELCSAHPEWGRDLADAPGFTRAHVVQACLMEGATRVEDVVLRRLRLPLHLDHVAESTIEDIAHVMESVAFSDPAAPS